MAFKKLTFLILSICLNKIKDCYICGGQYKNNYIYGVNNERQSKH